MSFFGVEACDWSEAMGRKSFYAKLICMMVVVVPGMAQPQQRTLVVDGHPGHVPVIEAGGNPCVGIVSLAHLVNGSLSFSGNQITLTLHGAPASQPESQGLSKDFLSAGIEAMSEIREWHSVLQSAVRYGFPTNAGWVSPYQNAATASVRQASVAASTESDHNAAQLLTKELDHMQQLSDKMTSARKNLTYIAPDALENDPLDKKIVNCAHALGAMAASGQFHDDGSCH
jgi:hypothetical protein